MLKATIRRNQKIDGGKETDAKNKEYLQERGEQNERRTCGKGGQ